MFNDEGLKVRDNEEDDEEEEEEEEEVVEVKDELTKYKNMSKIFINFNEF